MIQAVCAAEDHARLLFACGRARAHLPIVGHRADPPSARSILLSVRRNHHAPGVDERPMNLAPSALDSQCLLHCMTIRIHREQSPPHGGGSVAIARHLEVPCALSPLKTREVHDLGARKNRSTDHPSKHPRENDEDHDSDRKTSKAKKELQERSHRFLDATHSQSGGREGTLAFMVLSARSTPVAAQFPRWRQARCATSQTARIHRARGIQRATARSRQH